MQIFCGPNPEPARLLSGRSCDIENGLDLVDGILAPWAAWIETLHLSEPLVLAAKKGSPLDQLTKDTPCTVRTRTRQKNVKNPTATLSALHGAPN
jgi:hypothetical protein